MKREAGKSLIGMMVAVVILLLVSIVFITGNGPGLAKTPPRPDGKGETVLGRSALAAKDDKCRAFLGQIRQSVQINADPVEGTYPAKIEDTKLGQDFYKCPVGKEPYGYDPTTGKAWCVHKGHEKY